jgi:hypothetical protein
MFCRREYNLLMTSKITRSPNMDSFNTSTSRRFEVQRRGRCQQATRDGTIDWYQKVGEATASELYWLVELGEICKDLLLCVQATGSHRIILGIHFLLFLIVAILPRRSRSEKLRVGIELTPFMNAVKHNFMVTIKRVSVGIQRHIPMQQISRLSAESF